MVVLSISICTRGGKPIVARQFVEMTRARVEMLLAAFPKLLKPSQQHTYVENDSVRYMFQPLEGLYLVLVTTKTSNVVEDLDTIRLLSKVVTDACPTPSEEAVVEAAFDLVHAFDEVITLGYREAITLQGVKTNVEMNSHEEKLSRMIRESKEQVAKHHAKVKEKQLAQKAEPPSSRGGGMQGYGPGSQGVTATTSTTTTTTTTTTSTTKSNAPSKTTAPKKGIQLSKKNKEESMLEAMAQEDGIDNEAFLDANAASAPAAAPGAVAVPRDPVSVSVSETISCKLLADGSLSLYEISGQASITCRAEEMKCVVQIDRNEALAEKFQFKTHPQLDKVAWESSATLALKQKDRPLPANTAFGALKYRSKPVQDVSEIPLNVTVWPELAAGGKGTNVNVEYQLQAENIELYNVTLIIPLNSQSEPQVVSVDAGVHRHNSRKQQLEWIIDVVSNTSNTTGSLEFNLPAGASKPSTDGFFPTIVSFSASKSLAGLSVSSVQVEGQPDVRFGVEYDVKTESFQIVSEE